MPAPERTQVFISYSHMDRRWLERLQTMLKPLTHDHTIDVWDDTRIKPGTDWKAEIEKALAAARVAVLLVSDNFLASDFIENNELPPLLTEAAAGGLTVLWVAVSPCRYDRTAIARYQAANNPAQPLDSLRTVAWKRELVKITKMIEEAASQPNIPVQTPAPEPTPGATRETPSPLKKTTLPEMILIPAGKFLMGSDPEKDKDARDDERPQHPLFLPDY